MRQSIISWDKGITKAADAKDTAMQQRLQSSREFAEARLVQVLVSQGKLFEAELVARGLLRRTLSRVGKDSPQSGSAVMRMAQVLLALRTKHKGMAR